MSTPPQPYRPVEHYAPAGAASFEALASLTRQLAAVRRDLDAIRAWVLTDSTLHAATRERLRNAEPGQWFAALSGLSDDV